jgi:DNA-binding GntR family transcriptional regulator
VAKTRAGLKSINAPSLVDLAYEQLLEQISRSEYREGDRIVIDTVAKQLGVSRIPVREALARLHAQHLLSYERNKGYRVSPKHDHSTLFEARLLIEPSAIRYFGHRATSEHITELRDINRRLRKLDIGKRFRRYIEFFQLNDAFHAVIVSICGNQLINEAYKNLSYGPQWARFAYGKGIPDLKIDVREHDDIIDALEKGDLARAEKVSEDHILNGLKRFNELYVDGDWV